MLESIIFISPIRILRRFFLLVTPSECIHEKTEDIPNYINDAIPYFFLFIILEFLILSKTNKPIARMNDAFSSISAGLLQISLGLVIRNIEVIIYIAIWTNYRFFDTPWNSAIIFYLCFICVDFQYYWLHRCSHEINWMWAAHQVHHSSQDYNLTTALRQSCLQQFHSWIFYIPLALVFPPQIYIVHHYFNLLWQFWIHTQVIEHLNILELFLNTPRHHRVHHGRNHYCIDKNYGGILIIWDRLFGTFSDQQNEEISYGLVHNVNSWNPIYIQLHHWERILKSCYKCEKVWKKFQILCRGPSWNYLKNQHMTIKEKTNSCKSLIMDKNCIYDFYPKEKVFYLSYIYYLVFCSLIKFSVSNSLDLIYKIYILVDIFYAAYVCGLYMEDKREKADPVDKIRLIFSITFSVFLCKTNMYMSLFIFFTSIISLLVNTKTIYN